MVVVKRITEFRCELCGLSFKPGDTVAYIVRGDGSLGYVHVGCCHG
jgi:hypothetical protein